MAADLVKPSKRPDAYALFRMSSNFGIAIIGLSIGGFIALVCAAAGLVYYSLLLLIIGHETLPTGDQTSTKNIDHFFKGYRRVLQDRPFMLLVTSFALAQMAVVPIWVWCVFCSLDT